MVDRIYRKDKWQTALVGEGETEDPEPVSESEPIEDLIPKAKRCTACKGPFDKGVEIICYNTLKGYQGTFCSYGCSSKAREVRSDAEKDKC